MKARDKLTKARANLLIDSPFFGVLAMRLGFHERKDLPTMAVDGKRMFYNVEFVERITDAELRGVIAHEIMHCALMHIPRLKDRHPEVWNVATDMVINDLVTESGLTLPNDAIYAPDNWKGETAEYIYAQLMKNAKKVKACGWGNMENPPPGEKGDSEEQTKIAVNNAANMAKAQARASNRPGMFPECLERFATETVFGKVDWRQEFRHALKGTLSDRDWQRLPPSRKYASMGLFLPSMTPTGVDEIAVGVDCSGSVDQDELNAFAGELNNICVSCSPKAVHVIYFAVETEYKRYDRYPLKLQSNVSGGTSFHSVWQRLEQESIHPTTLVMLTDMYADIPPDPGYPVIWCATSDVTAPYGKHVRLEV